MVSSNGGGSGVHDDEGMRKGRNERGKNKALQINKIAFHDYF